MKLPFERIVATHGAMVLRVCRAIVGFTDAEDAWSETFLAALRAYPQLPNDANVEAWLVTIAHRKAIDMTRIHTREAKHAINAMVDTTTLPGHVVDHGVDQLDIWDAVNQLPPKQRQAVAYHYLGGLPYAEVAQLIGGSPVAARRAAADGIASLRKMWDEDGDTE